ncbi:hypothetical protein [Streptomyces sp. NPDC002156]
MSKFELDDVLPLMLKMVPETRSFVEAMYEVPPGGIVPVRESGSDIYAFLLDCLAYPVLLPELRKSEPNSDLVKRCFSFAEMVMGIPGMVPRGAVYFQILEQLMESETVLMNSLPFLTGVVRERVMSMLSDFDVEIPLANDEATD